MNFLELFRNSLNTICIKYLKDNENKDMPIFYIGGSQSLPPPLTPEEEKIELEKLSGRR